MTDPARLMTPVDCYQAIAGRMVAAVKRQQERRLVLSMRKRPCLQFLQLLFFSHFMVVAENTS